MPDADEFDSETRSEREIGREMVDQDNGLGTVISHLYRAEMGRVTTWRQRLDETSNWAVTVLAGVLVYAFSGSGTSHAVLLAGIGVVSVFLGIEARRYQDYGIWRSRLRMIQENLFANALDPSAGVEHPNWRAELSRDYRNPTIKIPYREALQRRLRRVYLPLLAVLLVAWIFRLTALSSESVADAATLGRVPGLVVIGAVGLFYVAALAITVWPQTREAKEEFDETELGKWKEDD